MSTTIETVVRACSFRIFFIAFLSASQLPSQLQLFFIHFDLLYMSIKRVWTSYPAQPGLVSRSHSVLWSQSILRYPFLCWYVFTWYFPIFSLCPNVWSIVKPMFYLVIVIIYFTKIIGLHLYSYKNQMWCPLFTIL